MPNDSIDQSVADEPVRAMRLKSTIATPYDDVGGVLSNVRQ